MMTKKNKKRAGFSLIELLFAMLFLSVIVFGVIKLQTSNVTLSNTRQLELKAHSYAAQGLEILDAFGASVFPGDCVTTCYLENSDSYSVSDDGKEDLEPDPVTLEPLFERSFTYTSLTNAALVTMIVEWTDSAGEHSASAQRIILN
ncbi:hypothetical protein JXD20_02530 [Candidatus Peregrinibacteria bacterium]|nr:hypothetical protein [Candidatus Peregrinibacteria bacterium]